MARARSGGAPLTGFRLRPSPAEAKRSTLLPAARSRSPPPSLPREWLCLQRRWLCAWQDDVESSRTAGERRRNRIKKKKKRRKISTKRLGNFAAGRPGREPQALKLRPPWLPVPPGRGPKGTAPAAPSSPALGQRPCSPRAPAPPLWRCSEAPGQGRINTREWESAGSS